MLNKIYQSDSFSFVGNNKTFFFCTAQNKEQRYILKLDWNFNIIADKIEINTNNLLVYRNQLLISEYKSGVTFLYEIDDLSRKTIIPFEFVFIDFFFYRNLYLGKIQDSHSILLDLDKGKIIKNFGVCNSWHYIFNGEKILCFDEKPSKIYDDSTVCSYLRVIDFHTYEPIWEKDLYDFCFYDELYSNNCFERTPTVLTAYKDNLILWFKKHILCLNIETGETIWHIEDRYKEVEVVGDRLFLDKGTGYHIANAHTGWRQLFIRYPKIVAEINYSTPDNGESRYYKGYIWRTTRYEREGSETLLVIEPTTGKYVHIEKIPAKSMLNAPQFMEDKVILTSRSEAEFFIYQISDFDSLEK